MMRERNAESISSSVAVNAVWLCDGWKTRSARFSGDTADEDTAAEEELPAIRMGRFYRRARDLHGIARCATLRFSNPLSLMITISRWHDSKCLEGKLLLLRGFGIDQ